MFAAVLLPALSSVIEIMIIELAAGVAKPKDLQSTLRTTSLCGCSDRNTTQALVRGFTKNEMRLETGLLCDDTKAAR